MMHLRKTLLPSTLFALSFASSSSLVSAQDAPAPCPSAHVGDHGKSVDGKPLASPAATAETRLDGKTITIHYNTPSVRCRTIMGGVVPYDKVWRTGANPATTLITATNLKIGDLEVPAGTYTVYSLPEAPGTPWQLIINQQTGQWGTEYKPDMDLGRTPMMSRPVAHPQEVMSLSFEDVHGRAAALHIRWADADEFVSVVAE